MAKKRYKLTFKLRDGSSQSVFFEVPQAKDGSPGKTPVRGVDYWTASDKAAIISDILDSLPAWNGGAY